MSRAALDSRTANLIQTHPMIKEIESQESIGVLIVEDDEAQREILSDLMHDEGLSYVACGSTAEALACAKQQDFAVAIVDQHLPDGRGTELLKGLQQWSPATRAIIHTGHASFDSAREAVNHRAFAYVEKRGHPAELIRHVQRAVQEWMAEVLQRSQADYQRLVESVQAIVWRRDPDTLQFTFVNREAETVLGYPVAQWLIEPGFWQAHLHAEDRKQALVLGKKTAEETQRFEMDYRMLAADGRVVWFRDIVTAFVAEGQPKELVGVMIDVTARKQAEEALKQYAKRLEILQDVDRAILTAHSPEEIAGSVLHHVQQLIPCLHASVTVFDLENDVGTVIAALAPGETRLGVGLLLPLSAFMITEAMRRGTVNVVEDIRRLGNDIPETFEALQAEGVRSFINAPLFAHDELVGMLNVGADRPAAFTPEHIDIARGLADLLTISIRQANLDAELARHAHELEDRVHERTEALARANAELDTRNNALRREIQERKQAQEQIRQLNQDLQQHADDLEAANHELEAFTYSVAHDLRSPLRAIDGFAELFVEDYGQDLPPEASEYLDLVQRNARQMGQLIDDLLSFSRLGRQPLKAERVDVAALTRKVLSSLLPDHDEAPRVETAIGELPPCQADPALLRQVLTNLLSNALKFSRVREAPHIEVGAIQQADETLYYVRDNGVGFDMAYADKLFGVFERLHLVDEYEGTGVGLAVAKRIIDRHGGRIWAEAALDEGATFYFTLS